jgi:Cu/Ag efflux protein CusF
MKRTIRTAALVLFASVAIPGLAQATSHATLQDDAHADVALTEGEVRKVDKEAKKLTIRHGPLENLGMPAMTMVFQVKDPAMLDAVKAGDKVKFTAARDGGSYIVMQMEVSK